MSFSALKRVKEDDEISTFSESSVSTSYYSKTSWIKDFFTPDRMTPFKIFAFLVTYVSYAIFFGSGMRKILPSIKPKLEQAWMFNSTMHINDYEPNPPFFVEEDNVDKFLYDLRETTFMSANAVGIISCGFLGDRFESRILIFISAIICSITLILIGPVAEITQVYNGAYYTIFVFIFGVFQGFAVPTTIKIIFNWRKKTYVGLAVGFMAVAQQSGTLIEKGIANWCLPYGYEHVFTVLASLILSMGIIVYFGLVSSPHHLEIYRETRYLFDDDFPARQNSETESIASEAPAIGLKEALLLENIIPYCLCNFFLNMINFSLFYFNPAVFLWGTEIVGGLVGGALSDKFGRNVIISIGLVCSLFVFIVGFAPRLNEESPSTVVTAIVAVLIKGIDVLIEAAVAIDIAAQQETRAVSTLTGLIDGAGALGLTIGRIVTPLISNRYGWQTDFYLYLFLNLIAISCISRLLYKEVQTIFIKSKDYRWALLEINNRLCGPNFRQSHSVSILYT